MYEKVTHGAADVLKRVFLISLLLLVAATFVHAEGNVDDDFITLYPGVFTDREKPLVEAFIAGNQELEARGCIDVQALIAGTLPEGTPGIGPALVVTEEMMRYNSEKYDPENPVFNVAEYARELGYENIIAYPTFAANDDAVMKAYPADARDKLLVGDLNHSITMYKPIYPGDTLYTVINKRFFVDATPPEGSTYRSVAIQSEASIYNQRGEKVNDAIFRVTENIRILKEGRELKADGGGPGPFWEAPAWTNRPAHYYTDKDWKKIKELWKKETRQGNTPLYWEDVKIGDRPTITVDGPILESVTPTIPYGMGTGGSRTMKKEMLDSKTFKTMVRDEATGIYTLPDREEYILPVPGAEAKKEAPPADMNLVGVDTSQIHKAVENQRSVVFNFMGRDMAIRHINNWMGDHGWLYNIRWSIMAPSALAAVGKTGIPESPLSSRFVQMVPGLDKEVTSHPLTGDIGVVNSYVYDKYVRDGEFYVDLVWWVETIDGDIWQEGGATVKLPSKDAE